MGLTRDGTLGPSDPPSDVMQHSDHDSLPGGRLSGGKKEGTQICASVSGHLLRHFLLTLGKKRLAVF